MPGMDFPGNWNKQGRYKMTFGETLRKYRKRKGLSLKKLGEYSEIGPGYLGDLERGVKNRPSLITIHKLIEALDLTKDEGVALFQSAGYTLERLLRLQADIAMNEIVLAETIIMFEENQ
jgi:transcriptional regulator with XRE-family HTH domain